MDDKIRELIRELITQTLEEMSTSGGAGGYSTPFAFKGKNGKNKALPHVRYISENLNEASYRKFKNKVSETTQNAKIRKSISSMKRSIKEMNSLIDFSNKLKEEMGPDHNQRWIKVKEQIDIMSADLNEMRKKLKTLYK